MAYRSQTSILNDRDFESTFTAEYDEEQTAAAIITPTTGKLLKIVGVYISTEGATTIGQKIRLYFATTGDTVVSLFPSAVTNTATTFSWKGMVKGVQDEALSITTNIGEGKNYFVSVNYKEE